VLLGNKDVAPGTVDLFAPTGVINAGDAGIGSSGNIFLGAQQVIVIAAVRLVTRRATLAEGRLMVVRLLGQVGDIAVATQADIDRIGFRQPRLPAGVRAMAVSTVARSSGMLHFSGFDQLGFILVAGHAQGPGIGLRQHHFSILGGRVADFALLLGEWRMGEFCQ